MTRSYITKFLPLCCLLWLLCTSGMAQQERFAFTGKVTDQKGETLIGATVYLHELKRGTITDLSGAFKIENLKKGSYHLHVSFLGYHGFSATITIPQEKEWIVVLEPSVNELHEVIIEGSPLKESLKESVSLIESINQNFLQKNTGSTLMNSLSRLPGVNTMNMGMGVSKPVIRGLSFNRVMVTDSGIKQEGQQWGTDHGLEIDQFNIEQLEIIKGPASLAYGSDAIGGVINIRQPTISQEGQHEKEVRLFYKSVNETVGTTVGLKGNEKGWVYRLRGTWLDYADYRVPATDFRYGSFVLPIENGKLKNTAGEELHFSGMVGINRSWGYSHLTVSNYHQKIGMFSGATGVPRAYQLTSDGDDRDFDLPYQTVDHLRVVSNSNIHLGQSWLEIDLGYQRNVRNEFSRQDAHLLRNDLDPNATNAVDLQLQTYTLNARLHTDVSAKAESVWGAQASFQQNQKEGFEHLLPDFTYAQAGIFWIGKWKINERWNLSGGARAEMAQAHFEEAFTPFISRSTNQPDTLYRNATATKNLRGWAMSLGAAFNPSEHWSYKLNLSKTFRLPSAAELAINGFHHGTFRFEQGNLNLKPEEGYQLDAAILFEKSNWLVSVSPYFYFYQNFIFFRPTGKFGNYPGQIYQYAQSEALHTGGEFSLETNLFTYWKVNLSADYVWAQKTGIASGDGDFNKVLPLPFMPQNKVGASLEYQWQHWWPTVLSNAWVKVNQTYRMAQNRVYQNELATPSYFVSSFSAGATFFKKGPQLSASFQIENLFNARYLDHLSRYRVLNLPEPGRNVSVTVGVKW